MPSRSEWLSCNSSFAHKNPVILKRGPIRAPILQMKSKYGEQKWWHWDTNLCLLTLEPSSFHFAALPFIRGKLASHLAHQKAHGKCSKDVTYYYHHLISSQLLAECFVWGICLINLCWFDLERTLLYSLGLLKDIFNESLLFFRLMWFMRLLLD